MINVIPSDLACSYIFPSTSLETALVHSVRLNQHLSVPDDGGLTIENSELRSVIEYPSQAHLSTVI